MPIPLLCPPTPCPPCANRISLHEPLWALPGHATTQRGQDTPSRCSATRSTDGVKRTLEARHAVPFRQHGCVLGVLLEGVHAEPTAKTETSHRVSKDRRAARPPARRLGSAGRGPTGA